MSDYLMFPAATFLEYAGRGGREQDKIAALACLSAVLR